MILNPVGLPPTVHDEVAARRPDNLDRKTVFIVDDRFDDSGRLLVQLQELLMQMVPTLDTRMVQMSRGYREDDPALWQRIQAEGDAAIIGVGH